MTVVPPRSVVRLPRRSVVPTSPLNRVTPDVLTIKALFSVAALSSGLWNVMSPPPLVSSVAVRLSTSTASW